MKIEKGSKSSNGFHSIVLQCVANPGPFLPSDPNFYLFNFGTSEQFLICNTIWPINTKNAPIRQRFMKTCSLDVTAFGTFRVQQPYSRTDTTYDFKSRNFKVVLKLLFRHATDNIPNAALTLLIRFSMSISVPPPAAIIQGKQNGPLLQFEHQQL